MNQSGTQLELTYRSLIRVVVVAAVVAVLIALRRIVSALLFAVVVAAGIEPGVRWFSRFRVPRILAVLIIYLVGIAILAGVISLILPPLLDEFSAFLDAFPRYQRILLQELRSFQGLPFYQLFSQDAESLILNPPLDLRSLGGSAVGFLFWVFGGIFSGIILLVVSFYLASQEQGIERVIRLATPLVHEEYVLDLWTRAQSKIGFWLRGQALLGLLIGILVYLALTILGIPYALLLALLAAIFELIPIIGPILAAVPAVFFGFLVSPMLGLVVAAVYVIIQQVESHLIVPLVMRRTVGLNPLVVIIALLAGGTLGGILGMFLAVPAAAVVVEFLMDTDRKKRGLFQSGGQGSA